MDERRYNTLKNNCKKAENKLDSAVGALAKELQPYFKDEISVFYQPSDGFVVLVLNDTPTYEEAPPNLPIDEVFKTINKDPKFYLS